MSHHQPWRPWAAWPKIRCAGWPCEYGAPGAELLAFIGVAVVVIVTPGQDTALTVRNTLAGGRRAGIRTASGVVCGQAVWALAASGDIAALLVASGPSFIAVKLAAVAHLVYLGCQALLAAARRQDHLNLGRPTAGGRELRQGC